MILTEEYERIVQEHQDHLKPISELSRADNSKPFVNSQVLLLNGDSLAKALGDTVRSPDAFYVGDNQLYFLEFKDRKYNSIKVKEIKEKIYEGLSVFSHFMEKSLDNLSITVLIICNPNKNSINNPVQAVMQHKINHSTSQSESTLRTKHKTAILERYFNPLQKLCIKINCRFIMCHLCTRQF